MIFELLFFWLSSYLYKPFICFMESYSKNYFYVLCLLIFSFSLF